MSLSTIKKSFVNDVKRLNKHTHAIYGIVILSTNNKYNKPIQNVIQREQPNSGRV